MLNRINPALIGAGRVLPLRSGQFSLQSPAALVLPGQIWFTPETIIWDGLCVVKSIFWFWLFFRRLVSRFALRVLIIACLIFLIVGFANFDNQVAANVPGNSAENQAIKNEAKPHLTASIVASESPIFAWPVPKTYISTYFSSRHKGIDIPNPYGTPVKPLATGVVIFAGWDGDFGKTVAVKHAAGFVSRYSHLAEISVGSGQKVDSTVTIGRIGTTGFATGPHLHFEVHQKGVPINPLTILPQ